MTWRDLLCYSHLYVGPGAADRLTCKHMIAVSGIRWGVYMNIR